MINHLSNAFLDAQQHLAAFCQDASNLQKTADAAQALAQLFQNKHKVLIAGNGGSLCDAMHFAEEFTGRFRQNRPALPAIALADAAHITCVGNDYGFEEVFARGVTAFGQKGDCFIGLSTSGNSENILRAVQQAKEKGLLVILLLGKDGGRLRGLGDLEFIAPGVTSDRIQEIHMLVLHIIIEGVERILFPEHYSL